MLAALASNSSRFVYTQNFGGPSGPVASLFNAGQWWQLQDNKLHAPTQCQVISTPIL